MRQKLVRKIMLVGMACYMGFMSRPVFAADLFSVDDLKQDDLNQEENMYSEDTLITSFNEEGSIIIPFSISCISFEIPKINNKHFKGLEQFQVMLDLDKLDIAFDVSSWQVGVFERVDDTNEYSYKKELSSELKGKVSLIGQTLVLDYPTSILEDGKYKIVIYVKTGYLVSQPTLARYKAEYVGGKKKLTIPVTYSMAMKVAITENITLPDTEEVIGVKDAIRIAHEQNKTTQLYIPYGEIPRIS